MGSVVQLSNPSESGIRLTQAAIDRVLSYLAQHHYQSLRLSIKKTGCSGLSYVMDYVMTPLPGDVVVPLTAPYSVCIEKTSYPYLKGLEMDFVKQGLNTKFVFNNPNQTGQCGCGESFTVE